jgi:AcrR family transcriptional regulator
VAGRPETREALIAAAYACIARQGLAKTSIGDVAGQAGVVRATVYRHFPGGRDELIAEVVSWEHHRFFVELYVAVRDAENLAEVLERALFEAHRAIADHEVLQLVLATEPTALSTVLLSELAPVQQQIAAFLEPYVAREQRAADVDVVASSSFLSRLLLSYMGAPGRWDLTNRDEVARLVRTELLAGITEQGSSTKGAARRH